MSAEDIKNLSVEEKKEAAAAPAPAPFQFNFAASVPAAGAAPAPAGAPFQFNFAGAGTAPGAKTTPFAFASKKEEGAELAEPADEEEEEDEEGDEDETIKAALEQLPPWSRVRTLNLLALSKVRDQVRAEFRAELRELERKYEALCDPIDAKRAAIVGGAPIVDEPTAETTAALAKLGEEDASKPIDQFWLKVLQNSMTAQTLHECDEPVLEYLTDIRAHSLAAPAVGFQLEFEFRENPYFTNKVLTKSYHQDDSEDPVLTKVVGTEIAWHPSKNTTVRVVKKTQKSGRGGKNKRVVMQSEPCDSFFHFFSPPAVPTEEDAKATPEEELEAREEEVEQDYNLGCYLRDNIVPDAVSYFLGVADDEQDDDDDVDWEGMNDDDEDEEEHGDSEEEEEPAPKQRGGRGGKGQKGGRGGGNPGQNPPECKQQ